MYSMGMVISLTANLKNIVFPLPDPVLQVWVGQSDFFSFSNQKPIKLICIQKNLS